MRRISIHGAGRFVIEDSAAPEPAANELLIAPLRVGICATDMELLDGSMVYLRTGQTELPLTPGHEWVGVVVGTGADVDDFSRGDIVTGECSIGCGRCADCLSGNYHQCADRTETGVMGMSGALAQYMRFPARAAHVVPPTVALPDAALIEPTAVAYRALKRLAPAPGERVLVIGGGTLGYLATALLAGAYGADVSVLTDRKERRRRVDALGCRAPADGERFRFVVEAAGTADAMSSTFSRLAPRGRAVLIGLTGSPTYPVPLDGIVVNDQEIVGSLGSPGVWPAVIELIASGAIRPGALVTGTYPLQRYGDAVDVLSQRLSGTGKLLIAPHESASTALAHDPTR